MPKHPICGGDRDVKGKAVYVHEMQIIETELLWKIKQGKDMVLVNILLCVILNPTSGLDDHSLQCSPLSQRDESHYYVAVFLSYNLAHLCLHYLNCLKEILSWSS